MAELKSRFDISEQSLFPDVYGFAQSHKHTKLIEHFSAEEFYQKGEEEWLNGGPEWAAEYFRMAYTKKPDWIDARCKCALALNWNGEQNKAARIMDSSVSELGMNWKFVACKSIIDQLANPDWRAVMSEAESIASSQKEEAEFRAFVIKYSHLPYY